jgi:hypothetical protein
MATFQTPKPTTGYNCELVSFYFHYCLLFNPDDGGDKLLRNIGLSPNYVAL